MVYRRPSGKTHFVNSTTVFLLDHVLRQPTDLEAACRAIVLSQHGGDGEVGDDLRREVAAVLVRLEDLGLVEQA